MKKNLATSLLLGIVACIGFSSKVGAQNAIPPSGPVIVNNTFGGSDPYANPASQPGGWFPGGIPILGGSPSLGGYVPGPMTIADRLWIRAEYLYWKSEGMDIPVLVTTSPSGTDQDEAGVLGQPGTRVLFGGGEINDDGVSGIRFRSGFWLTQQRTFAIESEYFQLLGDQDDGFQATGNTNGDPILGRPFFDVGTNRGIDTAQLISFPNLVSGSITVASDSELKSFLINGRAGLCPVGVCDTNGDSDRVDWIIGYRRVTLDDQISIAESLTSQVAAAPGTIQVADSFRSENEFNGLQLGVIHQAKFRRAWLESMLRVAVGNNTQSVDIRGNTSITENGVPASFDTGILAQRTNIGRYERDEFTMLPEIGLTLGIRLTDWLDATVGYSVLYFPSVVRAGSQIDTDLNSGLFAPEDPVVVDGLRPQFQFVESDYWAHGLNLGAELRF